jgi:cellulose synthase/poly-beta-1,6-N-acetylglucosamine synthase-like glycosyltransferase/peptidoglycan/xylan/chitin deacetylase (PgdA/CDA1 family)/spore germination protein YaaH
VADRPIFYDASGRRRRRFALAVVAFVLLFLLAGGIFAVSILAVAPQPELPFASEHSPMHGLARQDSFVSHETRSLRRALRYADRLWVGQPADAQPLAIAFHAPWDDASAASLLRHVDELDWLVPGWISITGANHHVTLFSDVRGKAILDHATHRPKLLPMIQNALDGAWDGKGMATLLHDPAARKTTLDRVEAMLAANHADGAFFDFEELPPSAQADYRRFLAEAHARFAPRGWIIAIAVPANDPDWDLAAYAKVADRLFVMAYDEHYQGGDPGPIASQRWFEGVVARAARQIPREKLVVALASYAYDWQKGGDTMANSVEEAWLNARESGVVPIFDPPSGNSGFAYDDGGTHHDVWLADAATAHNQIAALNRMGINAVALWRLGTEDPSLWTMFGRHHRTLPPAAGISQIPAGTNVDIEGNGEILRIGAFPVAGERILTTNARGHIINERFLRLPSPYQIQRTGYRPGLVALTFDDGPDPVWTPKILDILKAEHVPATFFIIGENALTEHGLLERLVRDGHEVGSHTYTHPNLANATPAQTALELNATQRLFQAFTGRSLRLFRAPYFGDAEPTTADEIVPVAEAQRLGYLSVGLHVDPGDWKRPGVQAIIDGTIEGVEAAGPDRSGQVVLLHDSGGDRAQTVAALPIIIHELRARGYQFVPVSTLANLSRDAVLPPISKSDRLAAAADLGLFTALGWFVISLGWIFTIAISLGILRAVSLSALALWQARKESRTVFPPIDPGQLVTVLIPAFNEERVIERAVRRVLASSEVRVEVIVIDDGSKDRTSAVVRETFADDPRVRLLTLDNGGKARALNRGLVLANADVVIALDADTQFEPTTIARLARWFADPKIGAVAGNAKVGNRVNLVTCWQALEYITAQNLERRALAHLNAMTVVPGAVGAWRRETLLEVGGYPADTLAEDQDLTITIQRAGWAIHYDQYAIAWTEAPESFRALARQRFRWAFGTLQCLWKHRALIRSGRPRGLAWIGLPQAMLFQILFAAISPIIDLALLMSMLATYFRVQAHGWAQTHTDIDKMLTYWLVFTAIDLLSGVVAFALERRERWGLLALLIPQRIGYRQVMYYVVLKAIAQALRGPLVGWGKLERSGRVAER